MRTSILFGREHGEAKPLRLLAGPSDPATINEAFKAEVRAARLAEIQLWSSQGGCIKRKNFPASAGQPTIPAIGSQEPPVLPAPPAENAGGVPGDDDEEPSLLDPSQSRKKGSK